MTCKANFIQFKASFSQSQHISLLRLIHPNARQLSICGKEMFPFIKSQHEALCLHHGSAKVGQILNASVKTVIL